MTRCITTNLILTSEDELRLSVSDLTQSVAIHTGDYKDSTSISFEIAHIAKLEEVLMLLWAMKEEAENRIERRLVEVVGTAEDYELIF
ncbi:hypothetical protein ACKFKF_29675 [Phormidesmis sp. 146-12]